VLAEFLKSCGQEEEGKGNAILTSVWATAVAVIFLQKKLPDLKNDGMLMAHKSTRWMDRTLADLPSNKSPVTEWLSQAQKLF